MIVSHGSGRTPRSHGAQRGPDEGSASLEFVMLGVLLLVPLVYLLVSVFTVQGAAYGGSAAAREAGRAFVQSPPGSDPSERAYQAARLTLLDFGIELAREEVTISCRADPCLTPGAVVDVSIDLDVALPFMPDLFGEAPASVAAKHAAVVDRFRPGS